MFADNDCKKQQVRCIYYLPIHQAMPQPSRTCSIRHCKERKYHDFPPHALFITKFEHTVSTRHMGQMRSWLDFEVCQTISDNVQTRQTMPFTDVHCVKATRLRQSQLKLARLSLQISLSKSFAVHTTHYNTHSPGWLVYHGRSSRLPVLIIHSTHPTSSHHLAALGVNYN